MQAMIAHWLPRAASVLVAAIAVLLAGRPAFAQEVRSELRLRLESEAGDPVAGALVTLVDSAGAAAAEGLSSEAGTRVLWAAPGSYRVRVRRIGHRPFVSAPVTLPHAEDLHLRIESPPVVLGTVVVTARARCAASREDDAQLATVWDEVAKALRATELTAGDASAAGRPRVYRRHVLADGTVLEADTTFPRRGSRRPFRALNPSALATLGYVIGSEADGWELFGADETTLLSEDFRLTHCFRVIRERDRVGQVGVAFEPVPRRPVSDVAGVLWLDEESAELRELVYRYTNAGLISRFGGGGQTRFRRMPSGAWIVHEWSLRVPLLRRPSGPTSAAVAVGFVEHGGNLVPDEP